MILSLSHAQTDEEREQLSAAKHDIQTLETALTSLRKQKQQLVESARQLVQKGFPEMTVYALPSGVFNSNSR